jgi:hypothetical protein
LVFTLGFYKLVIDFIFSLFLHPKLRDILKPSFLKLMKMQKESSTISMKVFFLKKYPKNHHFGEKTNEI